MTWSPRRETGPHGFVDQELDKRKVDPAAKLTTMPEATPWQSEPFWKTDRDARNTCARPLEGADSMEALLERFARRHLLAGEHGS